MSLPYFPMFPADFEAGASHLTLEEDGAYNRLLRLMWMTPGCSLPDDVAWIARRMRVDQATFDRVVKPIIAEFMQRRSGKVFSARLTLEWKKANVTYKARSEAGRKGGRPKKIDNKEKQQKAGFDFDKAGPKQPEPEPDKEEGGGSACARETSDPESQTDRETLLAAIGADPVSGLIGPNGKRLGTQSDMLEAERWINLGLTIPQIAEEMRRLIADKRDGCPPSSFRYFTPAMVRLAGAVAAPALSPTSNGQAPRPASGRVHLFDLSKFED